MVYWYGGERMKKYVKPYAEYVSIIAQERFAVSGQCSSYGSCPNGNCDGEWSDADGTYLINHNSPPGLPTWN